ncbi:MAG: hypothetical protein S4CHLAM7_08630 [Chlamydiae bacterium]|nr:hypothetical protein [Chlamydiota bacterium]
MIEPLNKIAIVAGNRLGDGLILQALSYNLYLNKYDVTFFNTPLLTLKDWFPWAKIKPHFPKEETREQVKDFQTVIFQHPNHHANEDLCEGSQKIVLYGPRYLKKKSLLDLYLKGCAEQFQLPSVTRSNGILIPSSLEHRKHKNRVVIHPSSLRSEKNWPREKFIQLAHKLKEWGYDPQFTVSPKEAPAFDHLKSEGFTLITLPKLTQLAAYIYESGFMIGNDSGIAHLASNINIPAIALFIRPGVAKRWHPNFSKSYPVVPWIPLPGPKLKERFWKQRLSVNSVLRNFKKAAKDFQV